jgi:hypothetical protein
MTISKEPKRFKKIQILLVGVILFSPVLFSICLSVNNSMQPFSLSISAIDENFDQGDPSDNHRREFKVCGLGNLPHAELVVTHFLEYSLHSSCRIFNLRQEGPVLRC